MGSIGREKFRSMIHIIVIVTLEKMEMDIRTSVPVTPEPMREHQALKTKTKMSPRVSVCVPFCKALTSDA